MASRALGIVVTIVAAMVGATIARGVREGLQSVRTTPQTAYDRAVARYTKRTGVLKDPALQAYFGHLSGDEAARRGMEMGQRGTHRLGDRDQVDRIRLISIALRGMDEARCAGFMRGTMTPEDRRTLVASFDSTSLDRWVELSLTGMRAELRRSPPALVTTPEAVNQAFDAIFRVLPTGEDERFLAVAASPTAAAAETCRLARLMYGRIETLPPAGQAAYAHAVTTLEAAGQDEMAGAGSDLK